MNRFFAPGGEFARIEKMFAADRFSTQARGLGDDGAIWEPAPGHTWVAASDASVEGVHFRFDGRTRVSPSRALRKALLSNLSDINAMGGRTRFALFNLGAPSDWDDAIFSEMGGALREAEDRYEFRVVGGDTTRVMGAAFFSFSVFGVVEGVPLLRSAARPGHRVYVTGTLGGSSAGLELLQGSPAPDVPEDAAERDRAALVCAHLDPEPPLELGPLLASMVRADRPVGAIDLSDGLSSELWHLARQSGCAITVDFTKLPPHPALAELDAAAVRAHMLHGGEEYQLLFTGTFTSEELARLRTVTKVTEIGAVHEGEGVFIVEAGETQPLQSGGYRHG